MSVLRIYGCTIIIISNKPSGRHNTFGSAICRMSSSSFSCIIKTIFHFILCKTTFAIVNMIMNMKITNIQLPVTSCQPIVHIFGELYPNVTYTFGNTVDSSFEEEEGKKPVFNRFLH